MKDRKDFKKGQIVYSQGIWKCEVVEDRAGSISYIPLEGYGSEYNRGRIFDASKFLFTRNKL